MTSSLSSPYKHDEKHFIVESSTITQPLPQNHLFKGQGIQLNRENIQEMQKQIICKQIEKLQQKNIQKEFVPKIRFIESISAKFSELKTKYQQLKTFINLDNDKHNEEMQRLYDDINKLKEQLYNIQSTCNKYQYQKDLLLNTIDCFQNQIRQAKQEQWKLVQQEKTELLQQKQTIRQEIEHQRSLIKQLSKQSQKLEQEVHFFKTCEIDPLMTPYLISKATYDKKIQEYQQHKLPLQIKQSTEKLFELTQQSYQLNQQLTLIETQTINQNRLKIAKLNHKVEQLSVEKLRIDNLLTVQHMKLHESQAKLTNQQKLLKEMQQLVHQVETQPVTMMLIKSQSYDIAQNRLSDSPSLLVPYNINIAQLSEKVMEQKQINLQCTNKLQLLNNRLDALKQANSLLQNTVKTFCKEDSQHTSFRLVCENRLMQNSLNQKVKNTIAVSSGMDNDDMGVENGLTVNAEDLYTNDDDCNKVSDDDLSNFVACSATKRKNKANNYQNYMSSSTNNHDHHDFHQQANVEVGVINQKQQTNNLIKSNSIQNQSSSTSTQLATSSPNSTSSPSSTIQSLKKRFAQRHNIHHNSSSNKISCKQNQQSLYNTSTTRNNDIAYNLRKQQQNSNTLEKAGLLKQYKEEDGRNDNSRINRLIKAAASTAREGRNEAPKPFTNIDQNVHVNSNSYSRYADRVHKYNLNDSIITNPPLSQISKKHQSPTHQNHQNNELQNLRNRMQIKFERENNRTYRIIK